MLQLTPVEANGRYTDPVRTNIHNKTPV